jgi:hypothetical protein
VPIASPGRSRAPEPAQRLDLSKPVELPEQLCKTLRDAEKLGQAIWRRTG